MAAKTEIGASSLRPFSEAWKGRYAQITFWIPDSRLKELKLLGRTIPKSALPYSLYYNANDPHVVAEPKPGYECYVLDYTDSMEMIDADELKAEGLRKRQAFSYIRLEPLDEKKLKIVELLKDTLEWLPEKALDLKIRIQLQINDIEGPVLPLFKNLNPK